MDNPYDPPREDDASDSERQNRPERSDRFWAAILLATVGAPMGATLCSYGYLGIILILETVFVPPLHSPENYGQFGFLLIYFGFCGLFYGASFGLIPYTRFLFWLPSFLLISWFAISGEFASNFDATEVISTGMIVLGSVIVMLAAATSFTLRYMEARNVSTNGE